MMERVGQTGICPSLGEIGRAMVPPISRTRVTQLLGQLEGEGIIERHAGSKRNFHIRDAARSRSILVEVLRNLGWAEAPPLEPLRYPCTNGQLPVMPPFEHLPDI